MIRVDGKPWDANTAPTMADRAAELRGKQIDAQRAAMRADKGKVMAELMRGLREQGDRINGSRSGITVAAVERSGETFQVFVQAATPYNINEVAEQVKGSLLIDYAGATEWNGGVMLTYVPASEGKGGRK